QPFTVKGSGFGPQESVDLVLYSDEVVALRSRGRANPRGDVLFSEQVETGTAPGSYVLVLEGPSRAKGASALRVVQASTGPAVNWTKVSVFSGSSNLDTVPFDITEETWRLVWNHRPKAF